MEDLQNQSDGESVYMLNISLLEMMNHNDIIESH